MDEFKNVTLQGRLFQDLLEINQAMARGSEKVLDMIWHKGARLIIGDEIIGVMNFNNRAVGAFDESCVRIAETFACQTALAVNNVRLNRREERARKSLELSRAINEAINATLDLDEVMRALLTKLDEIGKASAVDVFLYDREDRVLRNAYRLQKGGLGSLELRLDQGLVGATARSRRAINVGDVSRDPRYLQVRASTRSELTMPMVQCGELIGVINLESDQLDAFDEHDEKMLEAVAIAACIAIRNARERQQLEQVQEDLRLAGKRIIEMEDSARFALTTYIHDEVQNLTGRLLVRARQWGDPEDTVEWNYQPTITPRRTRSSRLHLVRRSALTH